MELLVLELELVQLLSDGLRVDLAYDFELGGCGLGREVG